MIVTLWRYSHLTLALVASLFLVLASVTGIILAVEPIQNATKPYKPENLSKIPLATTVGALQDTYAEVMRLEKDPNDFLVADVLTQSGESKTVFIHPLTAEALGQPQPQHPLFQFATTLHRSLFLKGIGRFFMGLASFLLCLIATTGLLLLIKRQGGLSKLFDKVQKDHFALRYHVVLGRWFLIPIVIVALTGAYLSAEKFSLLPAKRVVHKTNIPKAEVDTTIKASQLPYFHGLALDQIRWVNFPFSELPEDYFELSLRDKELHVHQYTGEVLSEQPYTLTLVLSNLSMVLHTGQGAPFWALALLLASLSILFFLYTGIALWRRRIKNSKIPLPAIDKDECSHIILVGSETGTTYAFAHSLERGLSKAGKKVFVAQINDYAQYAKVEQLIFLTATYGDGDPPTNARNIKALLQTVPIGRPIQYCVVGFGSLCYPKYCNFAVELNEALAHKDGVIPSMPLYKINNQSVGAFTDWASQWGEATGTTLTVEFPKKKTKKQKPIRFNVVSKTGVNADDTFLLELQPLKRVNFRSGDLLAHTPEDGRPRWYSIAKMDGNILLGIKRHELGSSSPYLSRLGINDELEAMIKRNPDFHFPHSAPQIVCIANGTGIAPFLGIINENTNAVPIDLYWGGRTRESFSIYKDSIEPALRSGKLNKIHLAFSKEVENKDYVQGLLKEHKEDLAKKMDSGAVFMLCGAIAMQNEVVEVLAHIAGTILKRPLSDFEHNEQLKMDCY